MKFLRNMFRTAAEFAVITQQCAFYEEELKKANWKNQELEKQLQKERTKKDTVLLKYCDNVSRQQGLLPNFTQEEEKKVEPQEAFSDEEEAKFIFAAEEMRKADIAANIEPPPIETYVEIIKKNPDRYLLN